MLTNMQEEYYTHVCNKILDILVKTDLSHIECYMILKMCGDMLDESRAIEREKKTEYMFKLFSN